MLNTLALVVWLLAATVPAFTVRNPLYLALILGAAWIVYLALGQTSRVGRSWSAFVKIGLVLLAIAVPFNALSSHYGSHILFRLPPSWPILGGPITLEGAATGAVNGLGLLTILVVLAAFNAVVDHYQLLRLTPAFIFQAGMVASIAITFVPQMVLSAAEIRQAQQIRGHRFRGIRDLLPLAIPLLATGLEKAIQLAETMEARGFAGAVAVPSRIDTLRFRAGVLGSLVVLLAGLFLLIYMPQQAILSWALIALGVAGLAVVFWLQGKRVRRTWYRRAAWRWPDSVVSLASVLALAVVAAGRVVSPGTMIYNPYSGSLLPSFDPVIGAGLLLLVVPALLALGAPATYKMEKSHDRF